MKNTVNIPAGLPATAAANFDWRGGSATRLEINSGFSPPVEQGLCRWTKSACPVQRFPRQFFAS